MSHLPTIISDLAMILLVAGVTTIIFKKINQPLVLGYIVAGFITGPNFPLFPTIADSVNISSWSEIGVIFLMFALGLEFSFYKLKEVGTTAFIAFSVILCGMLSLGYLAGNILSWTPTESLLLGGMLSMSSTAIIIKAFDDLKLRAEKFTGVVFGVLIIEDIIGIIMLVLVSTLAAASSSISSVELLMSIARLIFFIVLWFVSGMYLIPSFFKWAQQLMNEETLVVVSIGLCLGMVVLATSLGFSSALGAFIMGSLIAEAPEAEKIEHLFAPIKNLFSAVFFVSVGMMVNPGLLVEHWLPVLVIVLTTIGGQLIFSTLGIIASGQNLHTAVRSGFALTQIGEFSFIIASLATGLGMISDYIYPIIVAVSVITTFTTPFCIGMAEPAYARLVQLLPEKLLQRLDRYTDKDTENAKDSDWKELLTTYVTRMTIFLTLLFAIGTGAQVYLLPYLHNTLQLPYANLITAAATLAVMSPILRAILVNRADNSDLYAMLWFKSRINHLPLIILIAGKILIAVASLYFIFNQLAGLNGMLALVAIIGAGYFISSSDWLMGEYLRIESRFLVNLNEKHMRKHRANAEEGDAESGHWFDEELLLATYRIEQDSPTINKSLINLAFRKNFGFNILQIVNKNTSLDMPGGNVVLKAEDKLLIIGTESQINIFTAAIEQQKLRMTCIEAPRTLRQFMLESDKQDKESQFISLAITIDETSPILGTSLKAADLRHRWNCLVIGIERGVFTSTNPNVSLVFEKNDLLWILGKQPMMKALLREEVI